MDADEIRILKELRGRVNERIVEFQFKAKQEINATKH
jgi:hypothetical protein